MSYNRLTCAYNIAGTSSFRLSSRALLRFRPDKGFGKNLQNLNDEERRLCIPDEGKIFGQTDQAGAEALVVAYLCKYGRLRELFINKIKSHVYVALHIYKDFWAAELGLPNLNDYLYSPINKLSTLKYWNELSTMIKKDSIRYYVGKKTCHASNYGIGPITLQLTILKDTSGALALSVKECKELLGSYHNIFPEIRQWHIEIQEELKRTRTLKNLFNFPHQFHQPFGEELWKAGYAFIPQSTVATITNIAITNLQNRLDQGDPILNSLDLLANGHDSILYQCFPEKKDIIKEEVEKEMKVKLKNDRGEEFTMGVETNFGMNWGKFHPTDNPEGLK